MTSSAANGIALCLESSLGVINHWIPLVGSQRELFLALGQADSWPVAIPLESSHVPAPNRAYQPPRPLSKPPVPRACLPRPPARQWKEEVPPPSQVNSPAGPSPAAPDGPGRNELSFPRRIFLGGHRENSGSPNTLRAGGSCGTGTPTAHVCLLTTPPVLTARGVDHTAVPVPCRPAGLLPLPCGHTLLFCSRLPSVNPGRPRPHSPICVGRARHLRVGAERGGPGGRVGRGAAGVCGGVP